MADVIRKATNRFTKGLIMDFSPENTKNEVLTNALNATLLTFNGNELSLQNDMGNGRVETAYLPDGYMPVGTCEYGGIVYIVSYNPLENKSLIGCFPSPERNISGDELGIFNPTIAKGWFLNFDTVTGAPVSSGEILNNSLYVILRNDNLNPGDKFIVCSENTIYNERLADLWVDKDEKHYDGKEHLDPHTYELVSNPIIALNVVSIEDSGKIVYLNNDIRKYEYVNTYTLYNEQDKVNLEYTDTYNYHILGKMASGAGLLAKLDIDSYRNILNSGYSVFKSKTSGKLAILAELIMIDSYSVTHSILPRKDAANNIIEGTFDIVLHTEVSPQLLPDNYFIAPKLLYYYLQNSQGYILITGGKTRTLFTVDEKGYNTGQYDPYFNQTRLDEIYEPIDKKLYLNLSLGSSGKFNFPLPYTYSGRMETFEGNPSAGDTQNSIYTKFVQGKYHRLKYSQINKKETLDFLLQTVQAKFYYYVSSGKVHELFTGDTIDESYTYYTRKPDHIYHDAQRDERYKGQILYNLVSLPIVADEDIIYNEAVEKFQSQEVHTFLPATPEDLLLAEKLYYKTEGDDKYTLLTGTPVAGVQYYILKIEHNVVSIGFKVEQDTTKGDILYYPTEKTYIEATPDEIDLYYDFEKNPYDDEPPYGSPITLYWREDNWLYVEATEYDIANRKELNIELFYSTDYILLSDVEVYGFDLSSVKNNQLFIVVPMDTFVVEDTFKPSTSYNWINGFDKPASTYNFPKDDPIFLYTLANFIPEHFPENSDVAYEDLSKYYSYRDLKLANITLPSVVSNNGLDLPFKYDYTIVPCMNYGKLQHLAVSNTIDFSKLHAFNQSKFHTWKYRIDNNQLRLTFGTDIYDTYETHKVDGIVLEFYDCWGFAGSLEILDKKSYSGIFTKVIPLNSFRALSNKRVLGNTFIDGYKRNINLIPKGVNQATMEGLGEFTRTDNNGWNIPDKHPKTQEELDDCGTLYSNILYGVKTYFRRNVDGATEFIKKDDFFVYTLPIYNEFYYTILNFNNLTYPELELVLTYKLKDTSSKLAYTGDEIEKGYNKTDKENIDSYLGGFYEQSSLDLIKYYKYVGLTDLYLEIGLKKDYELLNLSYDPLINLYYYAKLKLYSDHDLESTFTVNSGVEGLSGVSQILNYNNFIKEESNKLGFTKSDNSISNEHDANGIYNANFINRTGNSPIKISYEFIVGYSASIANIRSTQVQATTVCALFHKKPTGEYNYEDFGVYEQEDGVDSEGNPKTKLLCNAMFYNEGTAEKEVFGICLQISTTGVMDSLLRSTSAVETEAREIKLLGLLNAGNPLKLLVGSIGKLTFCLPHAHGLSSVNGVNIHEGDGAKDYGIPPEKGGWAIDHDFGSDTEYDQCYGINPRTYLYNNPKYNLSLNTKNAINYNSEFISTLLFEQFDGRMRGDALAESDREWVTATMRRYTGFTGDQIATFNQKMIKTMSSVYAYNPDYDLLTVKVGNISLQDHNPSFTSNLINTSSTMHYEAGLTLNDFVYLGPIKFQDYLNQLHTYSKSLEGHTIAVSKDGKVLPQLQLKENFDYCGTLENKYLISSLTYNTPVPSEIEQELEFTASNITVIKHTDGSNTFMLGTPNKKTLYGYLPKYDKMLQLDVTNYTISEDGTLTVDEVGSVTNVTGLYDLNKAEVSLGLNRGVYNFDLELDNGDGSKSKVRLSLTINRIGDEGSFEELGYNDDSFMVGVQSDWGLMSCGFRLYTSLYVSSSDNNYLYNTKIDSIEFECRNAVLDNQIALFGPPIPLTDQSYEDLQKLVSGEGSVNLVDLFGTPQGTMMARDYWIPQDMYGYFMVNGGGYYLGDIITATPNEGDDTISIACRPQLQPGYMGSYLLGLFEIKLKKINFTITKTSKLENTPESFVQTTITRKFSQIQNHVYTVLPEYLKARLRGSSLTLNDLVYSDAADSHRLFIRNNASVYDPYLRGKLYYRFLNGGDDYGHDSWNWHNTKYLNSLFIYTGPCYTTDNL